MDTPSDPGDERLERRLRLGVRLVFYPLALGLIAFAWHARYRNEAPTHALYFLMWSGRTAQGQPIKAWVGDNGLLTSLDTQLNEPCSDGSTFRSGWYPALARFTQHGDDVDGRADAWAHTDNRGYPAVYDTRVRAHMGAHPHGTLTGQVTLTTERGTVICRSGPVTFALRRGSLPATPPPATRAQHRVPQPR